MTKEQVLKQYFGHSAFRPGQQAIIDAVLQGRDALGVMPTGAGKSMCYQIPALLLPGITIVVSPLISLMKDQVTALTQAGVPAAFINSSLSAEDYQTTFRQAMAGAYRLLYVAPERLITADFRLFSAQQEISFVAVDEAHCVSQWGQDFRPSYLQIAAYIASLDERPVVGAFTATATAAVKTDVTRQLGLREPLCLTTGFDRPNLSFEVLTPKSKSATLRALLQERREKTGIVYCATRKSVDSLCAMLREQGYAATRYHAGLEEDERRQNQEDFVFDRAQIMVATNAFGMGIDKSNVSYVIHYNMPKNLESYYQEAGRAGRDGEPAECILLFSAGDIQTARFLIDNSNDAEQADPAAQEQLRQRDLERLQVMIDYCKTTECLRAYILRYFGEQTAESCGNCGNCRAQYEQTDITRAAQMILSCVVRAEKLHPYGLGRMLYVYTLAGSKMQRLQQLGLDGLSTYGLLRDCSQTQIRAYIDFLIERGYLALTDGEYPLLRLTARARTVLFDGETVCMPQRVQPAAAQLEGGRKRKKTAVAAAADEPLLASLKALRLTLAAQAGIPAYMVFSNASLQDMAVKAPQTMSAFLEVSGVGETKAQRYGEAFLQCIAGQR